MSTMLCPPELLIESRPTVRAFVLIETSGGKTKDVSRTLCCSPGVISVEVVGGIYDVIATVEGHTWDDIGKFISVDISPVSGIIRTVVCPVGGLP